MLQRAINTDADMSKIQRFYEYLLTKVVDDVIEIEMQNAMMSGTDAVLALFELGGMKEDFVQRVILPEARATFRSDCVFYGYREDSTRCTSIINVVIYQEYLEKLLLKRPVADLSKLCGPQLWGALSGYISYDDLRKLRMKGVT